MRDIRNDLRERLAAIFERMADETAKFEAQADAYHRVTDALSRERDTVRSMLAIEDERNGGPITVMPPMFRLPLPDFLVEAVKTHGPMSKDDIRRIAADGGYMEEANGRTIHSTLMNAVRGGRLRQRDDGFYIIPASADLLENLIKETNMVSEERA